MHSIVDLELQGRIDKSYAKRYTDRRTHLDNSSHSDIGLIRSPHEPQQDINQSQDQPQPHPDAL